ncbi:MAG: aminotransferase class V-fold PLP-dependent enzyme [Candidatus Nanopelagicales bacterium]|nr:aminotransferase class V-fold PLP-dependent enzyme [Candidatus Nanopelagicales bacterium]
MQIDRTGQPADWLADAPLFTAWQRFLHADAAPFTIPGHKRRASTLDPALGRLLDADVPLHGGADTVRLSGGVLREAEARAAALWGADLCRFSTGGTTHTNQVLCLAVGRPGDEVLVARNAHRSVLSGLALAGLRPTWLPVDLDPRTGGPLGISVATVEAALAAHPQAAALLLTDPSYLGTRSDLPALIGAAHAAGMPVLVDQAWGAHLGFAAGQPAHALALGADAMVTSAHKGLPAFSQASLLLARTERLDPDRLDRAFEATHTTSPAAAILASIDAARAHLASPHGGAALTRVASLVGRARARLRAAGLLVPGPEDHAPGRFDPLKLVVLLDGRADGLDVEQALLAAGLPVEMADRRTVLAQVGLVDDATTIGRLVDAILGAVADPPVGHPGDDPAAAGMTQGTATRHDVLPPQRLTPRQALFAAYQTVPRGQAVGRVSAELVAPYPPGVPVLVPGEEVTRGTLDALDAAMAAGTRIAYAADPTLATLQVVIDARP